MDLGRLKRDTAGDHNRVESLIPLMRSHLTEELYRSVLLRFYCLFTDGSRGRQSTFLKSSAPFFLSGNEATCLRRTFFTSTINDQLSNTSFREQSRPAKRRFLEQCTSWKDQASAGNILHATSKVHWGYPPESEILTSEGTGTEHMPCGAKFNTPSKELRRQKPR